MRACKDQKMKNEAKKFRRKVENLKKYWRWRQKGERLLHKLHGKKAMLGLLCIANTNIGCVFFDLSRIDVTNYSKNCKWSTTNQLVEKTKWEEVFMFSETKWYTCNRDYLHVHMYRVSKKNLTLRSTHPHKIKTKQCWQNLF